MSRWILFIWMVLSLGVSAARPPSGGQEVHFSKPFLKWETMGRKRRDVALKIVKAPGQSFKKCMQVEVLQRTQTIYEIQINGDVEGQIDKGDVMLLSFFARCESSTDESALGKFTIVSQAHSPGKYIFPFTKTMAIGDKWKQFQIPFVAPMNNSKGYSVIFRLGGTKPQVLQFGGMELLNYQKKRRLEELPHTETRYEGIEPDAPWRAEAQARIEKHRKGDLEIEVVNRAGKPISGAKVHAELKRHNFGFGVAVAAKNMFGKPKRKRGDHSEAYKKAVLELFNKAVFENRMKWKHLRENDAELQQAIKWFEHHEIPLRGHVMVWPAWQRLPRSMQHYRDDPEAFRGVIEEHIRKVANLYPSSFAEWDVVNELYTQHEFVDLYGKEVVADWFRIAKEANPSYTRYINDFAILAGYDTRHQDNYYEWIKYLLEQGAALEGIGFQGHFRAPVAPEEIWRRLERFAQFGLEMQITEYDFEETDELLQARFTRDFLTLCFSHPQITGVVTWCLWEKTAWKPSAAFYTHDWKKKRIALAWEHMVKKEWHTDETRETGADGMARVRGFLGEYDITVRYGGLKKVVKGSLHREGNKLRVQL